MLPKLEGYAAAVLGELTDAQRQEAVTQLELVDVTVQSRSDLRAALTDTAISSGSRSAVLRELLTGRVNDVTVRLAAYAAQVSPGQDVPSVLSDLTHYAVVRARPEVQYPEGLSLLQARKRISGYADAILEDLNVEAFAAIEDDLFRWARTVESNPELRRILVDRDAPVEGRVDITRRLLEGKIAPSSLQLAIYVIEGGRPRDVVGSLDFLVDYTAKARDWRVARVWTARPIDETARLSLIDALRVITGHEVELQVVEDPTLLGGVLVQVGDLRLDATTKGRLGALRESIANEISSDVLLNSNS